MKGWKSLTKFPERNSATGPETNIQLHRESRWSKSLNKPCNLRRQLMRSTQKGQELCTMERIYHATMHIINFGRQRPPQKCRKSTNPNETSKSKLHVHFPRKQQAHRRVIEALAARTAQLLKVMRVVVLEMGNKTDPAFAAKATPKSSRLIQLSSRPW